MKAHTNTQEMNFKQIYKNADSFKRMLKNEGFSKKEIAELVGDSDIITFDELDSYRNFETKAVSFSNVCSRGGQHR
jgi:hypothetical protein